MAKKLLLFSIFFFLFPHQVLASPMATISAYPSSVIIDKEFNVELELSSLEASASYYVKSIGGADGFKVYTWSEKIADWLAWNASWSNMPEINASFEGTAKTIIISKFSNNLPLGLSSYKIRIRKVGTTTNYDFPEVLIEILFPPTEAPTSTLEPTNTPTPTLTPAPKPPTSNPTTKIFTPTPSQKTTPTPTLKTTNLMATDSGEILGEEVASFSAFYPYEATEEAKESGATPSAKNKILPKIFLVSGLLLLFASACWLWYNFKYHILNE